MSGKVYAPFTAEQLASLNGYQASGVFHEFTCGNDDCPADHAVLVAAEEGWHCPSCSYTQDWAHEAMADGSWKPPLTLMRHADHGPELTCRPALGQLALCEPVRQVKQ